MSREKEQVDNYDSEEDLDEDEAMQYIIEQSLIQYRKLKGLSPRDLKASEDPEEVFRAIKEGDEDALNRLMEQPRALSKVDERGWIPLHEAAVQLRRRILEDPHWELASVGLLRARTPLFLAVVHGLRGNATFLLQNRCNPDLQNDEQDSPLRGPNGALERTPLHESAFLELCPLAAGVRRHANAYDVKRKTPLALAAAERTPDNVVEVLLQKGAHVKLWIGIGVWHCVVRRRGPLGTLTSSPHFSRSRRRRQHPPCTAGHLPIHRVAYHVAHNIEAVKESGMSPCTRRPAGSSCCSAPGHDPNMMLHQRRRSALFFAVVNNDLQCARLLLEAGAMGEPGPAVSCLQVALRQGNYELINALLRSGRERQLLLARQHHALPYALKDEVMLRMILNHGYDVKRCFDCPYSATSHDYAPWTSSSVIKDMMFCEVITVQWLKQLSGQVVRMMLDYTDHVSFCTKLTDTLQEQKQEREEPENTCVD
ncbi:LOW QUALITY PROTEIN: hypothetical protein CRUP_003822 [Coryphaenoides rupestris]|nr:LOW QUALITY PROTEIN: hypothetical protein CRUP_003822 [Coryphaenoides rupestris]